MESLPINFQSASQIAAEIKRGTYTSEEVVRIHLDQIKKYNEQINTIVILLEEDAIKRAKEADEALARGEDWGPLHGVPITVKEAFNMKGLKTTLNAKILKDNVADEDAVVVTRLRNQGAIILGKTNIPEMLSDVQSFGPLYGRANNPYHLDHTPGGSSGGSAAAVSAGFSALDIGSDIGGSVRVPAHNCGLYSIKPTENTMVQKGHVPLLPGHKGSVLHMANIGPITRSIEDLELIFKIINGADHMDVSVPPIDYIDRGDRGLSSYRIAWTNQFIGISAESETSMLLRKLADNLSKHGATVKNTYPDMVNYDEVLRTWGLLFGMIIGQDLPGPIRFLSKLIFKKFKGNMGKGIRKGLSLSFKQYAQALKYRETVTREFQTFFRDYDVLLTPVALTPAVTHRKTGAPVELDGVKHVYFDCLASTTAIFNVSGHPAVIVPLGQNSSGLPIGLQIVGPYWSDLELIKFAKKIEFLVQGYKPPRGFVSTRKVPQTEKVAH